LEVAKPFKPRTCWIAGSVCKKYLKNSGWGVMVVERMATDT
jgi:hypothetical protein